MRDLPQHAALPYLVEVVVEDAGRSRVREDVGVALGHVAAVARARVSAGSALSILPLSSPPPPPLLRERLLR
jgi:hypothetical protein